MRRNTRSAFANPILIGAVTVLVLLIAVFLAYTANRGLPFVPTRELKVDIASGADLTVGSDVREGGFRIGLVSDMEPVQLPNGRTVAQLTLHLTPAHGRVPVNSSASIRPSSVLGTKYVDLHKGTSQQVIADGGTLPITQTQVPVQFDDIFQSFNAPTRRAIQQNLVGFGNALAGRGSALNDTLASLPALLGHLEPVARTLADPRTGLTTLIDSLNRFTGTLAPVAQTTAQLFTDMATTFEAVSRDPIALASAIAQAPPTLAVGTESLRVQQPFLANVATLGQHLAPATAQLDAALPILNPAIEAGTKTLKRSPILNANLEKLLNTLKQLALAPATNQALNGLTQTVGTLNPMVRYLGPFQTVCDDWNYWWTYVAEHLSAQTAVRVCPARDDQPRLTVGWQRRRAGRHDAGERHLGKRLAPADRVRRKAVPARAVLRRRDRQPGQRRLRDGQRGYPKKLNQFDPEHRNLALDPHTPGNQGPTFHGRARVPKGETFSRNPSTGPQLPTKP